MSGKCAAVGVSDHGGWAILVTADRDGRLLDRRRVELVDDAQPAIPHHHQAQLLPVARGVALVERVRASAHAHAERALDDLAVSVPTVRGIALRVCPLLPATVAECLRDYRARNVADWVMYRKALAAAAELRGWGVSWYDAKSLNVLAETLHGFAGPPWNKDYRLAMAAAISAFDRRTALP